MQPTVVDQLADLRVLSENGIDLLGRRLDEDTQSERLVDEAIPIVDGLQGQSDSQVSTIALEDT
jgi:hypothetical protein